MLSFYQKTRGTFLSTFREKMSQSWRKIGQVFLPYDPCRCRPSRTVFDQKYTQFPFVWWSKNMEHFCIFYDFYISKNNYFKTDFIILSLPFISFFNSISTKSYSDNKLTILIMLWIIDKIIMVILFWAMKQWADTLHLDEYV